VITSDFCIALSRHPHPSGATHRNTLHLSLPGLATAEDVHARGVDGPGANGIDGDAVACHLHGQRLRKALDAKIGGAIGGGVRDATFPSHRGEIDDAPPALLHHNRHDALAQQERSGELDLQDFPPDGLVQRRDWYTVVTAGIGGVGHQDIEAPKGLHAEIHQALHLLGPTDIPRPGEGLPAMGSDLFRRALDILPSDLFLVLWKCGAVAPGPRDHDIGPHVSQCDCRCPANAS
jgi:hypothetical protein